MRPRIMTFLFFVVFFVLVDLYLYQAVLSVSDDWTPLLKRITRYGFWIPTILCVAALSWWTFADAYRISTGLRNWILTGLFAAYFSKIFGVLFVFADDLQRGVRWIADYFTGGGTESLPGKAIPRSEFLTRAALVATAIP